MCISTTIINQIFRSIHFIWLCLSKWFVVDLVLLAFERNTQPRMRRTVSQHANSAVANLQLNGLVTCRQQQTNRMCGTGTHFRCCFYIVHSPFTFFSSPQTHCYNIIFS